MENFFSKYNPLNSDIVKLSPEVEIERLKNENLLLERVTRIQEKTLKEYEAGVKGFMAVLESQNLSIKEYAADHFKTAVENSKLLDSLRETTKQPAGLEDYQFDRKDFVAFQSMNDEKPTNNSVRLNDRAALRELQDMATIFHEGGFTGGDDEFPKHLKEAVEQGKILLEKFEVQARSPNYPIDVQDVMATAYLVNIGSSFLKNEVPDFEPKKLKSAINTFDVLISLHDDCTTVKQNGKIKVIVPAYKTVAGVNP